MPHDHEWTPAQSGGIIGPCYQCGKSTYLRYEPFSQQDCCKTCWEQIVYGTDEKEEEWNRAPGNYDDPGIR